MKRRARGTERFNKHLRSARTIGRIVLILAVVSFSTPLVLAQEETDPMPRVRNVVLHDAAVRINLLLTAINDRHLATAGLVLDKAQGVLERIADASEARARRGFDVSAVRVAIATAREALDDARSVVREQSEHEYILDDVTDLTVRDRLRAIRSQLAEDLRLVRSGVRTAVGAVRDAARALRAARPTDQ